MYFTIIQNTTGGFVILRLVELLSVGVQDHITFYINSGSTGFNATESDQCVWIRVIEDEEDKKKINCTAGDGFRTDWALVATWIGYEVKIHTHIHIRTRTHTYTYTYTYTCIHIYTCTHVHIYTYTHIHIYMKVK